MEGTRTVWTAWEKMEPAIIPTHFGQLIYVKLQVFEQISDPGLNFNSFVEDI